jgi:hypothetical protein
VCPGRKFIGYDTRALLAITLLLKYAMRLMTGETRPKIDLTRQGTTVNVPDRDPKIEIRLRRK